MSIYSNHISHLLQLVKTDVNYIWLPTKTITERYATYLENPKVRREFLLALNKDRQHVKLLNELFYDKFVDVKYPNWNSAVEMVAYTEDVVTYKCLLTKKGCSARQFIITVQPKIKTVQIALLQGTIIKSK